MIYQGRCRRASKHFFGSAAMIISWRWIFIWAVFWAAATWPFPKVFTTTTSIIFHPFVHFFWGTCCSLGFFWGMFWLPFDAAWPRRLRCNTYGINLEATLGAHERLGSRPDGGDAGQETSPAGTGRIKGDALQSASRLAEWIDMNWWHVMGLQRDAKSKKSRDSCDWKYK